jgi:hypothetical protein
MHTTIGGTTLSESIVISREVLQSSLVSWTMTITGVPALTQAFNYGSTDALAPFPLSSLFTTMTSTINNTNVNINLQDCLPSLLRMNDSRELYRYNSTTATLPDQAYLNYDDALQANNNPLAGFSTASYDVDQAPRGAFPLTSCVVERYNAAGVFQDNSPVSTGVTDVFKVLMSAVLTEPIFLSPFIYSNPEYNCGGFAGINTISMNLTVDGTCKRFFRTASPYTVSIALGQVGGVPAFQNTRLLFNFLSTQPSDMIPSRIVTPYMDIPRYLSLSNNSAPIAAWAGGFAAPTTSEITSQNIQLNQLPDLFIISVRIPMSQQTIKDSDSFLTINKISINLNNQSGLLASATPQDLWRISTANGSTQSWTEFSGKSYSPRAATGTGEVIPSTGSLLILSPPRDLSLPDYLSSSSIGQFNLQCNINVSNYYNQQVQPEICIMCVNSGVFVSSMGSSNIYTGVLTKQMVLDGKEMADVPAFSSAEYHRMVGGNLQNRISSAIGSMTRRLKKGKDRLASSVASAAAPAMSMLAGRGESGGRLSRHC